MRERRLCFVIGPIGNKFAVLGSPERELYEQSLEIFDQVVVPACEENALEPIRADQIAVVGEINQQIFQHLAADDLVIADISGGNANVMYELGFRHSIGKPTIQIGEYGQIPFDIAGIRTIQFSRSERGLIAARKDLERSIAAMLVEGADLLTPGRIANESVEPTAEEIPESVEDAEPGLVEWMADFEDVLPRVTETAEAIGGTIGEIGGITEERAGDFDHLESSSGSQRLHIIGRYAEAISGPSERLEGETEQFLEDIQSLDKTVRGIASFMKTHPDFHTDETREEFSAGVLTMVEAARGGMEGLNAFGTAVEGIAGISRSLRVPGKRIANSVQNMAEAVAIMDAWERVTLDLHPKDKSATSESRE